MFGGIPNRLLRIFIMSQGGALHLGQNPNNLCASATSWILARIIGGSCAHADLSRDRDCYSLAGIACCRPVSEAMMRQSPGSITPPAQLVYTPSAWAIARWLSCTLAAISTKSPSNRWWFLTSILELVLRDLPEPCQNLCHHFWRSKLDTRKVLVKLLDCFVIL